MDKEQFDINVELGRLIRKSRLRKGISGKVLGELYHISQQQVSRYERGISKFDLNKLIGLAIVLDISSHELNNIINQAFEYKNMNV